MINLNFERIKNRIRKINVNKLFYNNKFVAVFSFIMSVIIWTTVSSNSTESIPVTISDIPVDIQLSESAVQDGLKVFSGHDITARVEITGNRLVVGQVTKDNIQISASQAASTIISPGNYTLELSAKKVGILKDYEIVSDVKPSVITVMVDRYRESEFDIEPEINFTSKSGYFVGNTVLSSQKVTLSGPETEVSKIKKVKVLSNIPGEIDSSITLKLPIIMYDAYDKAITSETISASVSEVEASIPILMKKEIEIIPDFSNLPSGMTSKKEYPEIARVIPDKLEIAGPEDVVSALKSIKLDAIDFNKVNIQNSKFTLPINLPQGCRSLNNVYSADVNLNLSQFREKVLNINQFSFKNLPNGKTAKVYNKGINITVLAPLNDINYIKSSNIVAEIDFEGKDDFVNSMEMPVKLYVKDSDTAWIYGQYYVNVNLE